MRFILGCLVYLLCFGQALAAMSTAEMVPPALKPWTNWVLYEHEVSPCPSLYNQIGQTRLCAWPGPLALTLARQGGAFTQSWEVEQEGWIGLPGDSQHWPLEVTANGKPIAVSDHAGAPVIFLKPGRHALSGKFRWAQLPERLKVPETVALVQLKIDGAAVRFPYVDDAGMIWLRDQQPQAGKPGETENRHTLTVSRLISDDVPLKAVTFLDLSISGDARELVLGPLLLPGAIPLALSSRLPAKLEPDGRLRLQARPGRWTIEFTARFPGDLVSIALPAVQGDAWVNEEIWAFQANPLVRLAEVKGLEQIDPRQTALPEAWHGFPAYRMSAGQAMQFEVRRRGNPEAAPNSFTLRRQLWMDFDGTGFTVADQINGLMNRDWRMNMYAPYQLGRVAINGEDQVITHLDGERGAGVEIRQHQLQLSAESRIDEARLPGLGWDSEFTAVSGQLYLPPGWTLLSMGGVDQVSNSWIKKWTLLDIFLVLIITLAVKRLWDWRVAVLALALLTLTWHEAGAPRLIWLNLVIAIALWRALPEGTMKRLINWYRWASAAALVLLFLAFAVDAVREGIYPQLENPQGIYRGAPIPPPSPAVFMEEQLAPEAEVDVGSAPSQVYKATKEMADAAISALPSEEYKRGRAEVRVKQEPALMTQQVVDPSARRQTGPGLPRWQWQTIDFAWNGPVQADQAITLRLISPTGHLLLNLLSVVLMGALIAFMLGFDIKDKRRFGFPSLKLLVPLCFSAVVCVGAAPQAWAAEQAVFPDEAMLKELERRLVKAQEEPPQCAPQCAQSPRLRLVAQPDALTLQMEVHAGAEVAVPLPFEANQWLPTEVILDDRQVGVSRVGAQYYARVPAGVHRLTLRGPLPELASVRIPLPLNPYYIEAEAVGWRVEGITDGKASGQVQLLRQSKRASKSTAEAAYETQALPPFVIIERTLLLGIDWNVQTTVTRVSGPGDAISLEVPLLEGESVLSADAKVKNGKVSVTLGAAQDSASWTSSLGKRDALTLKAPHTTQWLEHWRLSVSPIWRIGYQGIPEIMQQSPAGDWMPQWWPWPGEEVVVAVTRPEGIVGATLTIDETRMRVTPGKRTAETVLHLQLRSSQGEQRDLVLPEGAVLQKLLIDEVEQPIQQSQNKVPLTIAPGSHAITLIWRQDAGVTGRYTTPVLDLGLPAVNNNLTLAMPQDRWILFAGGPKVGPAILFWGVLLVILLVAIALGRTTSTPLKTHHWLLLGVGFSQAPVWMPALVAAWFFLLAYRGRQPETVSNSQFNAMQLLLVVTTVLAASFMLYAIWQGLLGLPHMQIIGNGSWDYELNWYQDRVDGALPSAWVVSVPIFVYRMLMLAWALWLAFALLNWVQWGWGCFSSNGVWRKVPVPAIKKKPKPEPQEKTETQEKDKHDPWTGA
ncbi:MAG: hypothetical protein AB1810_14710 [Pseudomonadota bacterium]